MNVRGNTRKLPALAAAAHAAMIPMRFQKCEGVAPARSASTRLTPTSNMNEVTISARKPSQNGSCSKSARGHAVEAQIEAEVIGEHQAERSPAQCVDTRNAPPRSGYLGVSGNRGAHGPRRATA